MSLLEKYLEEAAEIVDRYTWGTLNYFTPPYPLLLGAAATAIVSFIDYLPLHLAGIAVAILPAAIYARRLVKPLLAATLFFTAATTVIAAPLLLTARTDALLFVTRTVSASVILLSATSLLGWRGVADSIDRLGLHTVASYTALLLRYVPLFLRDAARMLAAREARLLSRRGGFSVVSTVAGELVVRSYRRAYMLALAVEARDLGRPVGYRYLPRPKAGDVGLAGLFILLLYLGLVRPL